MAIRWPLLVRRTHKWLALVVGVQALLWTLTGFYMVVVHIDTIHGDHLVRTPVAQPFDLDGLAAPSKVVAAAPGVSEIRLQRFFGQPASLGRVCSCSAEKALLVMSSRAMAAISALMLRFSLKRSIRSFTRGGKGRLLSCMR